MLLGSYAVSATHLCFLAVVGRGGEGGGSGLPCRLYVWRRSQPVDHREGRYKTRFRKMVRVILILFRCPSLRWCGCDLTAVPSARVPAEFTRSPTLRGSEGLGGHVCGAASHRQGKGHRQELPKPTQVLAKMCRPKCPGFCSAAAPCLGAKPRSKMLSRQDAFGGAS